MKKGSVWLSCPLKERRESAEEKATGTTSIKQTLYLVGVTQENRSSWGGGMLQGCVLHDSRALAFDADGVEI